MHQTDKHLLLLIKTIVDGLGYELVGVEFNPHPNRALLKIYIDAKRGVLIEDCAKVSHQLSGMLDVENPISGDYQLEVSSPGVDRPFFELNQFKQFIGSTIVVNLFKPINKQRKITGQIKKVHGDIVFTQVNNQVLEIPIKAMSKARLVSDYTKIQKRTQ